MTTLVRLLRGARWYFLMYRTYSRFLQGKGMTSSEFHDFLVMNEWAVTVGTHRKRSA